MAFHSEPQFLEATREWKEMPDRFAEEHDGEGRVRVGTHVLAEDDRVRIWEMMIGPGLELKDRSR